MAHLNRLLTMGQLERKLEKDRLPNNYCDFNDV